MANTGNKIFNKLVKVTNDINEYPLDINDELCSVTGLAQAEKTNTLGDPNYIAPFQDLTSCPITGETIGECVTIRLYGELPNDYGGTIDTYYLYYTDNYGVIKNTKLQSFMSSSGTNARGTFEGYFICTNGDGVGIRNGESGVVNTMTDLTNPSIEGLTGDCTTDGDCFTTFPGQ